MTATTTADLQQAVDHWRAEADRARAETRDHHVPFSKWRETVEYSQTLLKERSELLEENRKLRQALEDCRKGVAP